MKRPIKFIGIHGFHAWQVFVNENGALCYDEDAYAIFPTRREARNYVCRARNPKGTYKVMRVWISQTKVRLSSASRKVQ